MSSDSGSRVQLTDCGTKPTTTAKVAPEHQVEAALRDDVMVLTIVNTQGVRPKARRSLSDFTEAGASSSSSVPSVSQAQHESLMRKASGGSLFGTAEIAQDFVMIDLKTPFAQTCVMSPYEIQMRLNPLLHTQGSEWRGRVPYCRPLAGLILQRRVRGAAAVHAARPRARRGRPGGVLVVSAGHLRDQDGGV